MEIDWSKSPEKCIGATIAKAGFKCIEQGSIIWVSNRIGERPYVGIVEDEVVFAGERGWPWIPRPEAWNGEGLPPIGKATCEYRGAHQYDVWTVVDIFAHWGKDVFVDFGDMWRAERDLDRFRPIRTPEQIAQEERLNKAIELYDAVMNRSGQQFKSLPVESQQHYLSLIDQGWQKVPCA